MTTKTRRRDKPLTDAEVREIRADVRQENAIALEWNITEGYVRAIKSMELRAKAGGVVRWAERKERTILKSEQVRAIYRRKGKECAEEVAAREGCSAATVISVWNGHSHRGITGERPKGERKTAMRSPEDIQKAQEALEAGKRTGVLGDLKRRGWRAMKSGRLLPVECSQLKHYLTVKPSTEGERRQAMLGTAGLCRKAMV